MLSMTRNVAPSKLRRKAFVDATMQEICYLEVYVASRLPSRELHDLKSVKASHGKLEDVRPSH